MFRYLTQEEVEILYDLLDQQIALFKHHAAGFAIDTASYTDFVRLAKHYKQIQINLDREMEI